MTLSRLELPAVVSGSRLAKWFQNHSHAEASEAKVQRGTVLHRRRRPGAGERRGAAMTSHTAQW